MYLFCANWKISIGNIWFYTDLSRKQVDHSPDNVKFPDGSRHSSAILGMLSVTHICRKGSSTSYVSLRSSVKIVWHGPTCPTNFNKSLEWNPDNIWDDRVHQHLSYQLVECRHWVTERFVSLLPGHRTVCCQQSLLRQPCIHSVEPWKLIYSPHLSHHLNYIVCILS